MSDLSLSSDIMLYDFCSDKNDKNKFIFENKNKKKIVLVRSTAAYYYHFNSIKNRYILKIRLVM